MKITIDISDPLDARLAWLAAIEAAPVWASADGQKHATSPPLWARLLRTALDGGWPTQAEYEPGDFDQALGASLALGKAVGSPAAFDVEVEWNDAWSYSTKNAAGRTTIRLEWTLDAIALTVEGPREEAVTRRMHAACAALESFRRGRGEDAAFPTLTVPEEPEDPVVVRRYTAVDEEQDIVSTEPVVRLDRESW